MLFPFGFHCTGMPIKACADRLLREMEEYGNPPQFPSPNDVASIADGKFNASETSSDSTASHLADQIEQKANVACGEAASSEVKQFKKKSKVASKASGETYQWNIMSKLGISDDEIAKFANPMHWLYFFPPLAMVCVAILSILEAWTCFLFQFIFSCRSLHSSSRELISSDYL